MSDDGNGTIKRLLIGSLELGKTHKSGEPVVDLYASDTRLKYPSLRLFDLSALEAVGVDPNILEEGQRLHRRFWAHYSESDKLNKDGRPYRDVAYLEPVDPASSAPAASPVDLSEILGELRAIRALMGLMVEGLEMFLAGGNPRPEPEPDEVPSLQVPPESDPEPEPPAGPAPDPAAPVPAEGMSLQEALLENLNTGLRQPAFSNLGHLLYGIRKASGNQAWTWADATCPQHWAWAKECAMEYLGSLARK